MDLAYVAIYLVPALLFLFGIWMILRLLGELGVGKAGRRICFVVLATLLLSPSIAGGVMAVFWVPNGLFLLAGQPPLLHLPRLQTFATTSFAVTAVVSAAVAWVCIRQNRPILRSRRRLARMGAYVLGVSLLLGLYYAGFTDHDIPEHVDWALIESEFGQLMDDLIATREIDDFDAAGAERERLRSLINGDPIFWKVELPDPRFDDKSRRAFFQRKASSGGSCTGQPGNHHGLMGCTQDTGDFFDEKTLRFSRRTLTEDNHSFGLDIEFDHEAFLTRYPGPVDYSPDTQTLQAQDQQLLGNWQLERRTDIGDRGPRMEIVSLNIGPRLSPGVYAVHARAEMLTLDRSEQATDCTQTGDRCKWFGETGGTLRIHGSRTQLIYEARGWHGDRLQLTSEGLQGIDPWGDKVLFERR